MMVRFSRTVPFPQQRSASQEDLSGVSSLGADEPLSLKRGTISVAGYLSHAPWGPTYLGALTGSVTGFCVAISSIDPISTLAVTAPPIAFARVGVLLEKLSVACVYFRAPPDPGAAAGSNKLRG